MIIYTVSESLTTTDFGAYEDAVEYSTRVGLDVSLITSYSLDTSPTTDPMEVFRQKLEVGFPIPNTPYYLAMQDTDRSQFASMLSMINEAFRYGYATGSTPVTIKDKDGNLIELTMENFQKLMISYGNYYIQIWSEASQ